VGISYVVVVLPGLARGKCLKVGLGVMLKAALGDLLGDLLGRKEDKRDVKIGSVNRKRSSTLERGRIKHIEQCQVLRVASSLTKGMRNMSIYVGRQEI